MEADEQWNDYTIYRIDPHLSQLRSGLIGIQILKKEKKPTLNY